MAQITRTVPRRCKILAAGLGDGFFDLVDQRARLGDEGAIGFETEVFAEFNQRVGGAGDAQQQIAFQQVRAGETRIKRQCALHFLIGFFERGFSMRQILYRMRLFPVNPFPVSIALQQTSDKAKLLSRNVAPPGNLDDNF